MKVKSKRGLKSRGNGRLKVNPGGVWSNTLKTIDYTMTLFFVGAIEMIVMTIWTKVVTKNSTILIGIMTTCNILIWYYVVGEVVTHLGSLTTIVSYTLGSSMGAMIGTVDHAKIVEWKKMYRKAMQPKRALKTVAKPVATTIVTQSSMQIANQ